MKLKSPDFSEATFDKKHNAEFVGNISDNVILQPSPNYFHVQKEINQSCPTYIFKLRRKKKYLNLLCGYNNNWEKKIIFSLSLLFF